MRSRGTIPAPSRHHPGPAHPRTARGLRARPRRDTPRHDTSDHDTPRTCCAGQRLRGVLRSEDGRGSVGWRGGRTSLSNMRWGSPVWGGGREGGPDVGSEPGYHSPVWGRSGSPTWGGERGTRGGVGVPMWGEDQGIAPQFGWPPSGARGWQWSPMGQVPGALTGLTSGGIPPC